MIKVFSINTNDVILCPLWIKWGKEIPLIGSSWYNDICQLKMAAQCIPFTGRLLDFNIQQSLSLTETHPKWSTLYQSIAGDKPTTPGAVYIKQTQKK